jgi:hypothetical protein
MTDTQEGTRSMTLSHDRLVAQRVLVRDMPDRSRIVATLRIDQYGGNQPAHFSATADIFEPRQNAHGAARSRRGYEPDAGGACHGAILDAFPGAATFVRMHLSDYPTGEPMHAEANGFYFLTAKHAEHQARDGYWWQAPGLQALQSTWRLDDVRDIPYPISHAYQNGGLTDDHRDAFHAFYLAQRDRWAREARAAYETLDLMPDVTDLRGYGNGGESIRQQPLPAWLIGADPETVDV